MAKDNINNNFDVAKYQKYARQKLQKGGGIKTSYTIGLWLDKKGNQNHIAVGCFDIAKNAKMAIFVEDGNVVIAKLSDNLAKHFDNNDIGYYQIAKGKNYVVIGNGKLYEDIKKIYSDNGKYAIKTYNKNEDSDVVRHILKHTIVQNMQ
ncbi:MAG: hypothetical protein UE295_11060 [Acutalibacteraceae bacterium]|nr:hypothetical protein [Acutalibacteraceae bacterium]